MEMQSTSQRASRNTMERYQVSSEELNKSSNDCIPDISSPSSFTQSAFQVVNDSDISQQLEKTNQLKCILLGDSNVGKSSLVISYTSNGFPDNHKSTAFDIYKVEINVEDRRVQLQICDTGGGDEVSSLRYLAYPDCHTFILCFSVIQPSSFYNLMNHWIKEIEPYTSMNNASVLLVGCRCDERNNVSHILDLGAHGEGPITEHIVRQYADKIRAEAYVECSALTQKNLKQVFDLAIWYSLRVYDRVVQEEQRLLQVRNAKALSHQQHQQKKSRRKANTLNNNNNNSNSNTNNSNKRCSDIHMNGSHNNRNSLKMKPSSSDLENKSLWRRFFCLS